MRASRNQYRRIFPLFLLCSIAFPQTPATVKKATIPASRSGNPSSDAGIAELRRQLAELKEKVQQNDENLWQVVKWQSEQLGDVKHPEVELDPASPGGYSRIDTAVGPLLLSMGKVETYLDGYKVYLNIANPSTIEYRGFKISASYGPRQKPAENWAEWYKKRRTKEFVQTQSLLWGGWNTVELIFPDTKPDAFGYLSISVEVNRVGFK